jgi:magnesium transporter
MSESPLIDDRARPPDAPKQAVAENEAASVDGPLTEEFVRAVAEAIDEGRADEVRTRCEELHPSDFAQLLTFLDETQRERLIVFVGGTLDSEVLVELDPDIRESVITAMRPEKVAEAVADLDTDDAAFLLEDLDEDVRDEILAEVPHAERLALNAALDYEEETAGRLMQREVFAAPGYWTVGQIIDLMRGSDDLPDRFYEIFVVDPVFLKTRREKRIDEIMTKGELRLIPVTMDQEEVAYLFEHYNLISAPVVDGDERLVGMITVDDVVEIVHEETHEDMLALGGVEADEGLSSTVVETAQSRFSWLAVNLGTAILASLVISMFDAAISQIVALAVLMPIVASMGGNAGTQTLTVAVRALATKDLTAANAVRIIWRETLVGGLNGVMFAVIMGVLAGLWYFATTGAQEESVKLGVVVGVAMIVNLVAAGLAGILVPLGLQRAGADPAVSSAVFVTTVTDVVGFFVFLGLAALVLL